MSGFSGFLQTIVNSPQVSSTPNTREPNEGRFGTYVRAKYCVNIIMVSAVYTETLQECSVMSAISFNGLLTLSLC